MIAGADGRQETEAERLERLDRVATRAFRSRFASRKSAARYRTGMDEVGSAGRLKDAPPTGPATK